VKILSTGDWHFNAGYDEDVSDSVDQITKYTHYNDINLVVNTGDVYERASDPNSRNLAIACIQGLAQKAEVVIVRGNHDAPGDLKVYNQIRSGHTVRAFEAPSIITFARDGETPVMLHILPWITKARWQSLHVSASKEEGDRTVSQLAIELLKTNVALHPGHVHILAGHLTVAGARAQNHQQMGADGVTLGLDDLPTLGFHAIMLGHIHLMQTLALPEFFYNGSIAALDYGETPDKYFSVFDTETGNITWVPLKTIHRQDIYVHWTPAGIQADEPIHDDLIKGARVRANLRVEGGDNVDQAKKQLEALLEKLGALEYKINPQVIPVSKIRAAEIGRAKSFSEKLGQYWEATDTTPSEEDRKGMLDKLAQLEDECSL
jgi:DNA repair exonuclease SbcCD nuclease subunit